MAHTTATAIPASVGAWVGVPYFPASLQPRGRRFVRIGGPAVAVVCGAIAFMPVSSFPMDIARAQVIVLLTPLWCLLALVAIAGMVVAVRYRFRASPRRQDQCSVHWQSNTTPSLMNR